MFYDIHSVKELSLKHKINFSANCNYRTEQSKSWSKAFK